MFDYVDFLAWKKETVQRTNLIMEYDERVNPEWEYWILIYYLEKILEEVKHSKKG
jgi:hypothetical protein